MSRASVPSRPTRSRTRAGRLRGIDALLGRPPLHLPWAPGEVWVELGFGRSTATLLDLREAMRESGWGGPILGLDRLLREPEGISSEGIELRASGFSLALHEGERPKVIRCMNVLRGYTEAEALEAHDLLGAQLPEEGLLIEGSCCPEGAVLAAHLMIKREAALERWGLLFFTDFSQGFSPWIFRDRLPRDLRQKSAPGQALRPLFDRWVATWEGLRAAHRAPDRCFLACAEELARAQPESWIASGAAEGRLIWTPPGGVPEGRPLRFLTI